MKYYVKENGQTVTTSTITNSYIYSVNVFYTSSASADDVLISTLTTFRNMDAPTAESYTFSTARDSNSNITGSIIASNFTVVLEESDNLVSSSNRSWTTADWGVGYTGGPDDFYKGSYNVSLADGVWGVIPAVTDTSFTRTVSKFSRFSTYETNFYNIRYNKTISFKRFKPAYTVTTITAAPIMLDYRETLYDTNSTVIDNPITISAADTIARITTKVTYCNTTLISHLGSVVNAVSSWRSFSGNGSTYGSFYWSITPSDLALISATTMTFLGTLSTDVASSQSTSATTWSDVSNLGASYYSTIISNITIDDNDNTIFSTTSPVVSFTSTKTSAAAMGILHSYNYYYTTSSVESSTYFSFNELSISYISLLSTTYGTAGELSFSTSTFSTSTSKETFTVEGVTSTISLEVGSLYSNGNYFYSTTFYGTLEGNNVYMNSWVYSANVSTTTAIRFSGDFNVYTIGSTYKLFGDPLSSTSISETSVISSIVYTTGSTERTVSESLVESSISTEKWTDAPIEYSSTDCTYSSYIKSTVYSTSIGPKVDYDYDSWNEELDSYYNLDATVTEMGSWSLSRVSTSTTHITSSYLNTVDYGTTYRLSELISSSSWFNLGNVNGTVNYRYSYNVNSMFSFMTMEDIASYFSTTLSNYTTVLATTYAVAYSTATEALSYSFTATQSNVVKTTGERFIDRVEISRTLTIGSYGRNTIAIYNGSTVNTISSNITGSSVTTSQDVSTVDRTFITSTADFTTETELVTQTTASSVSNRFINSASFIMSTSYEQQNDTLMFKTSWNVYSSYYNTSYYSTIDTIQLTISASTYESLYVPVSFTTTSGYTSRSSTTGSYSSSTLVTSISSYTTTWMPVYTTVDGVYVTTE